MKSLNAKHIIFKSLTTTLCCLMLSLGTQYLEAQDIYAVGKIKTDTVHVGQPFDYELNIRVPSSYNIDLNIFNDTLSKNIDIIEKSEVVKTPFKDSDDMLLSQTLKLSVFDTGNVVIPKVSIPYSKSERDSILLSLSTNFTEIYVAPTPIDTTQTFRAIKTPIKQYFSLEEGIQYTGIIIVIAAVVLGIIFLIKKIRRKPTEENKEDIKPTIPAIITAREKLQTLKLNNLWQQGKFKEYYTELTDIVREYLKGQFSINAAEMTSEEILQEVGTLKLEERTFDKLRNTLHISDFVKFAKAIPTNDENEISFNNIKDFIEDSYSHYQEVEKQKAEQEKLDKLIKKEQPTEDTENQKTEDTI